MKRNAVILIAMALIGLFAPVISFADCPMQWQQVGGAATGTGSGYNSTFVYNGVPYMAYQDGSDGNKIKVAYLYNGETRKIIAAIRKEYAG